MTQGSPALGPLACRAPEAAAALGISVDTFERYVKPHVRCVRLGTVRLYPLSSLQAFLEATAISPSDELDRRRQRIRGDAA